MRVTNFRRLMTGLLFAGAVAMVGGVLAENIDDYNVFELDGNATDELAYSGDDWSSLKAGTIKPMAFGFVTDADGQGDDILSGGKTKDTEDISNWLWKRTATTSVQDKDDIANAYAAAYKGPKTAEDLVIYFGADRFSNNGDSVIGFWFLQDSAVGSGWTKDGYTAGAVPFLGGHVDNDLLIVADFTQGGAAPIITVYEWSGGNLELVSGGNAEECNSTAGGTHIDQCAIVNKVTATAPWPFVDKGGNADFQHGEFFEGGVNLTHIFGGNIPCFTKFMAETRSSQSPTSTLSDFVIGEFPLCKLSITKGCIGSAVSSDGTAVEHTFGGKVTNDGIATLTSIRVEDSVGGVIELKDGDGNPLSLAPGAFVNWSFKKTTTQLVLDNTAVAKGNYSSHVVESGPAVAQCKISLSGSLEVKKDCQTWLVDPVHNPELTGLPTGYVVVKINITGSVCNLGKSAVYGLELLDLPSNKKPVLASTTLAPKDAEGDCTTFTGSYFPSAITQIMGDPLDPKSYGLIAGRYAFADSVAVTAATAYVGDLAKAPGTDYYAVGPAECMMCPPGGCPVESAATAQSARLRSIRK